MVDSGKYPCSDAVYIDAPIYPAHPAYVNTCPVNSRFQALSPCYDGEVVVKGPTSMKNIYTGVPHYYPYDFTRRPMKTIRDFDRGTVHTGTMYDMDLSMRGPHDFRLSYGYRAYPFEDHHVREERIYASGFIPIPDIREWQKIPVVREGTWYR